MSENFFIILDEKGVKVDAMSCSLPSGVKVVIAKSFDDAFLSELIRRGILPLLFKFGMNSESLLFEGAERLDFLRLGRSAKPGMDILCRMTRITGETEEFILKCAVDNLERLAVFECTEEILGCIPYVAETRQ